jgi:hypothetical protein
MEGVTQIEPGLGKEAMEEADPERQRLEAALAAAPFGCGVGDCVLCRARVHLAGAGVVSALS